MKYNLKNRLFKNYLVLILLLFIDSLGGGVRNIILPTIIYDSKFGTEIFGIIASIQALISIFILLPQANFIKHYSEIVCIRIGVIVNIVIYIFYSVGTFCLVAIGKFSEGFADSLMNSSLSKLVYDLTDNTENRGKFRALVDITSNIGVLLGPIFVGILFIQNSEFAFILVIALMIVGVLLSYKFYDSKGSSIERCVDSKTDKRDSVSNKYFISHFEKFIMNKNIVLLTIPTLLFASFDIFESLLLGQFLLGSKQFSSADLVFFWTAISLVSLTMQLPIGVLADKNRSLLFKLSLIVTIIGFLGLINSTNKGLIIFFGSFLYLGCIGYSIGMSVLFGNMTTINNRLSESEVYRMIRLIGSGLFSLLLSTIFSYNENIVIWAIMLLCLLAFVITLVLNSKFSGIIRMHYDE